MEQKRTFIPCTKKQFVLEDLDPLNGIKLWPTPSQSMILTISCLKQQHLQLQELLEHILSPLEPLTLISVQMLLLNHQLVQPHSPMVPELTLTYRNGLNFLKVQLYETYPDQNKLTLIHFLHYNLYYIFIIKLMTHYCEFGFYAINGPLSSLNSKYDNEVSRAKRGYSKRV